MHRANTRNLQTDERRHELCTQYRTHKRGRDATYAQVRRKLVQASFQAVHACHHVFHIEHVGEPKVQQTEELRLLCGERNASKQLQQVAEIIATVKTDPSDVWIQHKPGWNEQLAEVCRRDAVCFELLEVNSRPLEEVDTILGKHVMSVQKPKPTREDKARRDVSAAQGARDQRFMSGGDVLKVTLEIELPGRTIWHQLSRLICKRYSNLNDVQHVHVATQRLVVELCVAGKGASGACDNARELSVLVQQPRSETGQTAQQVRVGIAYHCYKGVCLDHFANDRHLTLKVRRPNLAQLTLPMVLQRATTEHLRT